MRLVFFIPLVCLAISSAEESLQQRAHSVYFATENRPPAFQPPFGFGGGRELFSSAVGALPESVLVQTVVSAGNPIGLSEEQSKELKDVFSKTYASIYEDADLAGLKSVLPHCLSIEKPTRGHYFLWLPPEANSETKVITFLHGFGGNFLFYLKVLKDKFPDCIIVLPTWGSTWRNGNARYIREVYLDIEARFGIRISMAHLLAISDGGAISFEIYNSNTNWFSDLVVLASMPRPTSIERLKTGLNVVMINGSRDRRFPIGRVRRSVKQLQEKGVDLHFEEIDADHFFFLSRVDAWQKIVSEKLPY